MPERDDAASPASAAAPPDPARLTPAMRQYHQFKQRHPECVLFFRMGDFYEMFYDDAKLAHRVLGVTLTQRTEGIPMAGVPYHAVDGYLRRMIQAGHRVAVCEQMQTPEEAGNKVIQRAVTRVVTPGTLTESSLLDDGESAPLAAIAQLEGGRVALAWAELSTGQFQTAVVDTVEGAIDEAARLAPRELLHAELADGAVPPVVRRVAEATGAAAVARPVWQFRQRDAVETLCRQFGVASMEGFGFAPDAPELAPAGAVIRYLLETQAADDEGDAPASPDACGSHVLGHLQPPRRFERAEHLVIDQVSLRSLEVEKTLRSQQVDGSLLGAMQDCDTAMGKRLLRQWLCYPLTDRAAIEARQRCVGAMLEDPRLRDGLRQTLRRVQDAARIVGRVAVGRATPRDLVALGRSLVVLPELDTLLVDRPAFADRRRALTEIAAELTPIAEDLVAVCVDEPPGHLREGGLFRDGVDAELDRQRGLQRDGDRWLANYQQRLIDQIAVPSLKVGFNKVFGFYIELSKVNAAKAPDDWTRKQTLKNAERYITPELKAYETDVLEAERRAVDREQAMFMDRCEGVRGAARSIQRFAEVLAELDVLGCFARRAARGRRVRPELVDEPVLAIEGGRHPVLDQLLGERFVPNDVELGGDRPGLALITGPNMAGKSTYIRQTALLVLLAHTGAWLPADRAVVGLCDRIFTRVGASDELHSGRSTFMVEMTETAAICHHVTPRSMVILDEIGRGTSTLDGLSLAWAIAEHLAARRCRTLFATHYHELTRLQEQHPDRIANLHVTVREWNDDIVFLHRLAPGATDQSYGVHVAKIAGLPPSVVARAREVLSQLAVQHEGAAAAPVTTPAPIPGAADNDPSRPDAAPTGDAGRRAAEAQLSLFTEYLPHPVLDQLRALELDRLSPLDAFDALRRLRASLDAPGDADPKR